MDSDQLTLEQLAAIKANIIPAILYLRKMVERMDIRGFAEIDRLRLKTETAIRHLDDLHQLLTGLGNLKQPDPFAGARSERDWNRQQRETR